MITHKPDFISYADAVYELHERQLRRADQSSWGGFCIWVWANWRRLYSYSLFAKAV